MSLILDKILTASNSFLCTNLYDCSILGDILKFNCGLWPKPLQGASRRILSNVFEENGGFVPLLLSSEWHLVESYAKALTHVTPCFSHVCLILLTFCSVLSIAIIIAWKESN